VNVFTGLVPLGHVNTNSSSFLSLKITIKITKVTIRTIRSAITPQIKLQFILK
jgi:hypothetical protein